MAMVEEYKAVMNDKRREEIRKGIEDCLTRRLFAGIPEQAREVVGYLHSQGGVIKVKCHDCSWRQFRDESVGMAPCSRCNSTGYIFEPLRE